MRAVVLLKRGRKLKKELRRELGCHYDFTRLISKHQVYDIQKQNPQRLQMQTAASLVAGCVKIEVTLYRQNGGVQLGYDVFVKDTPDTPEWICYDSPNDAVSFREEDMLSVLDRIVQQRGLSYTECSFEKLDGRLVKMKRKEADVNAL